MLIADLVANQSIRSLTILYGGITFGALSIEGARVWIEWYRQKRRHEAGKRLRAPDRLRGIALMRTGAALAVILIQVVLLVRLLRDAPLSWPTPMALVVYTFFFVGGLIVLKDDLDHEDTGQRRRLEDRD